ncbi:MAG: hypothetical protein U0807_01960 [Candidatus Binatia bacterium]
MVEPQLTTTGRGPIRYESVADTDRRWLLLTVAVFLASLGLLFGLYSIYRASGPHPEILIFMRAITRLAHWVLPGL